MVDQINLKCKHIVDTDLRQTHLNALERAAIVKTINTAKTLGRPVWPASPTGLTGVGRELAKT